MDPAMTNDGAGIHNFAEIWSGFQMSAAATTSPFGLGSDPMALDQVPTRAPANGGGRGASCKVNGNSNNVMIMSQNDYDNGNSNSNKRLDAVGSNVDRETKSTRDGRPKQDFVHVRARRGQATDSHSLAERARREKISERMKALQDIVPGCNRVMGKALVLDEIINYIQLLQRQVEFMSMKLEAVNARAGIDGCPSKDGFITGMATHADWRWF